MTIKMCMGGCSFVVIGVILLALCLKNSIPLKQNKILTIVICLAMVSTVADLMEEFWMVNQFDETGKLAAYFHEIINYLYFITRNLVPFLYLRYVIAVLNIQKHNSIQNLLWMYFPIITSGILLALTPFTDAVFYLDPQGNYQRGPFLFVLYTVSIYYLLLIISSTLKYRKNMPKYTCMAFCSFVIISVLGAGVQAQFPKTGIESFCIAICLLLTYLTIQRPEEMLDGTTGVLNRHAFSIMLAIDLKSKVEFRVFVIMLDTLPFWMDSLGIETVNKLLKLISDYLNRAFKGVSVYKISANQFCLIMNRYGDTSYEEVIEKIKKRFRESFSMDDFQVNLSAHYSIIKCPEDADTLEDILSMISVVADKSNLSGSDMIEVSTSDVISRQRFNKIDLIVKEAVSQNLLQVVYQPIYSVKEQRFTSAEALLRLKHSELGWIPPDEFIPIAEKNGAIIKMGQFVRETVFQFMKEHNLRQQGIRYIEINMSIVEGFQHDIVDHIIKSLKKYQLEPSCVNLELTETAVSSMPETLERNMQKLHEYGVSFSLDDYGTGYSNMVRMLDFPCNIIKIDKSLVQSAFQSESADTMLTGTLRMLKDMHKDVLAEGVETKEQAKRLMDMGCDYIQGYYYARPMPGAEFLKLLH